MRLRVKHLVGPRRGYREIEVELPAGATVASLIESLAQTHGPELVRGLLKEDGGLQPGISILVGGQNCLFNRGLGTYLKEGDVVTIVPVISGGGDSGLSSQGGTRLNSFAPSERRQRREAALRPMDAGMLALVSPEPFDTTPGPPPPHTSVHPAR